jgi:phosphotransferase family enzyme
MGERLAGGNAGGAVRIGNTVRRTAGPWTPAIHRLLHYLHGVGYDRCPLPLGIDEQGREVLTFLPGRTVGDERPWPSWVHSDAALTDVAIWLKDYHHAVADFPAPDGAEWRLAGAAHPGGLICHNDAAPYNAAWNDDGLVGFFDWDFAGPGSPDWDLAFAAFSWVPLHARHVVEAEGFRALDDRRGRLELLLMTYGWSGDVESFVQIVRTRLVAHVDDVLRLSQAGDPFFLRLVDAGTIEDLSTAVNELPEVLVHGDETAT